MRETFRWFRTRRAKYFRWNLPSCWRTRSVTCWNIPKTSQRCLTFYCSARTLRSNCLTYRRLSLGYNWCTILTSFTSATAQKRVQSCWTYSRNLSQSRSKRLLHSSDSICSCSALWTSTWGMPKISHFLSCFLHTRTRQRCAHPPTSRWNLRTPRWTSSLPRTLTCVLCARFTSSCKTHAHICCSTCSS